MLNRWHAEDREVILHQLGTDPVRGLAPAESSRRLREFGPNILREPRRPPQALVSARALVEAPLVLLLAAAASLAYLGEWPAALAVVAVTALNAAVGRSLREGADRVLTVFARLSTPSARVTRGGKSFLIPAAELVAGDLAEVRGGDRVAADMRLYDARQLFLDESSLTGDPLPVGKDPKHVLPEGSALADRANMLFAGTRVSSGEGSAIVTATGMRTEIGRIAALLDEVEPDTPLLQRQVSELGQALVLGVAGFGAVLVATLRLLGVGTPEALPVAVVLALAAVPAGLPAVAALTLSLGVRRLAGRGVTVRSLPAARTLGAVSVVGIDTTRTLTRNALTVRELHIEDCALEVAGSGYEPRGSIRRDGQPVDPEAWESLGLALRIGALSSSTRLVQGEDGAWKITGDPTEGALVTLAAKGGLWGDDLLREHPLLQEFPYTAERGRVTVLVPGRAGRRTALMRGTPDVVLAHCLHHRTAAGVRPLSPLDRERILLCVEEMTGRALRVVGLAYREDAVGEDSRSVERSLVWAGLVGMIDPPREGVTAAVAACRAAGVLPVIITGDHKAAAVAVAREIGALRPGEEAISGEEIDQLSPEALGACVERYRVFARVTAEHKLRIVRAWKRRGRVVAVSCDGVKDLPAIREADLGLALGRSRADIAREAADVALDDDAFPAVVEAVAQGRGIDASLRRCAGYLLVCAAAEALAVAAAAIVRLPAPLTPLRALGTNLVLLALPALALGYEKGAGETMHEPPRPRGERLPGKGAIAALLIEGGALAAAALVAGLLAWRGGAGSAAQAGTQAYATLALGSLLHAFSSLHRGRTLFSPGALSNRRLFGAFALSALLLAATVQLAPLGAVFGTEVLRAGAWLRVGALALLPLPLVEVAKAALRSREREE